MAKVHWIVCEPYDRDSRAMMNYILASCQELKEWVTSRRLAGELKPGGNTVEKKEEWLKEYLGIHKGSSDIPRYALVRGMDEVWELKRFQLLEDQRSWETFSVEARPGWSEHIVRRKKKIEYEEWLEGKVNTASSPRVTADRAVEQLFDDKMIAFRWGKVAFDEGGIRSIKHQRLNEEAVDYQEFFKRIERLTFKKQLAGPSIKSLFPAKDRWHVSITLAPKVEPNSQEGETADAEDSLYYEEVQPSQP